MTSHQCGYCMSIFEGNDTICPSCRDHSERGESFRFNGTNYVPYIPTDTEIKEDRLTKKQLFGDW